MPAAVRWASAGAVIAVAFVAAVASYTHMLDLARHAGEGRLAPFLPISVDGLVVAGSTTMVVRRRHGRGGGWLVWLAVSLGIGASLAANVVAADPTLVDIPKYLTSATSSHETRAWACMSQRERSGVLVLARGDLNENLARAQDWPVELAGRVHHGTHRPGLIPRRGIAAGLGAV